MVDDFEGDQAVSRRDFVEQPSRIPIDKVPLAADADLTEPLHATALDTAPLLPEQSPAALVTSDVVEDPRAGSKLRRPASRRSQSSDGEARWPSASEMSPEALREYLLSMEVAKPKPRPRRKHLDHKLERQRMKQELEDILARRADLMSLEEAGSAPPVMPERDELDRRFDGEETVQQASASSPPSAAAYQHPLYAGSASSSGSLQPIGGSNKLEGESIEEEILRLNDSVEALMISINELDKVKDPQIELSFTGPKTKNLQRARPDDELWTDLTGRAPGIVGSSSIQASSQRFLTDGAFMFDSIASIIRVRNGL